MTHRGSIKHSLAIRFSSYNAESFIKVGLLYAQLYIIDFTYSASRLISAFVVCAKDSPSFSCCVAEPLIEGSTLSSCVVAALETE
jgi:hypothetical protein